MSLEEQTAEDQKYFDSLLSLVPFQFYFGDEEPEEVLTNRYMKKKDPSVKIKHKEMMRAKRTQAKEEERYNPTFSKTVPQILAERAAGVVASKSYNIPAPIDLSKNKNAKLKLIRSLKKKEAEQNGMEITYGTNDMLTDRDDMKSSLNQKLNEHRRKRKVAELNEDGSQKDGDAPLSKRRKREEAKAGSDLATSSENPARRAKQERPKQERKPKKENGAASGDESENKMDVDSEGAGMQFGTFDFGAGRPLPSYLQTKKAPNHIVLKQIQEEKARLAEMDPSEAEEAREQKAWDTVMKRASGEKVRDRTDKLVKSIKRQESKKKKSAEKWQQRKDDTAKAQHDRAQKRADNIKKAIQKKRDKRTGKK